MPEQQSIPLCLFPSAHWFALCKQRPIINLNEIYLKQTFRNRYDIIGVNGKLSLTVPVEGQKGVKTPMKDIRITGDSWRKQHLATLRSSYGRAAYFEHYFDALERVLMSRSSFLFDLSTEALHWVKSCRVELVIHTTEEPWAYIQGDYTYLWEPRSYWPEAPSYPQVFSDRHPFASGLSIIDIIMNKGPMADAYIKQLMNTSVE
jgi:hypothetical protein